MEEYGFAWQAGLRQGSRLVEICKVAAVTLTHEQMIDLLRTSVTVKVVIIPPYEEGGPRRSVCVCENERVLCVSYQSIILPLRMGCRERERERRLATPTELRDAGQTSLF